MSALAALPAQPPGVPWPTEAWPEGTVPAGVELAPLLDQVFDPDGPLATTYAVVVVQGGRLIAERYDGALEHFDQPPTPVTADTPLLSWSMAKSVLHAAVGVLVGAGRLEPRCAGRRCPSGRAPTIPAASITLRQLLAMRDGLDWVEDYVDDRVSDVIAMLFGDGQEDMAHFAADRPLAAEPGTRFNYSSGTSNIVSGIVARLVGPGEDYARFLHSRLFAPIGMTSADPEFDAAGTWVASSSLRATARDWARFGLLYLRGGTLGGRPGPARGLGRRRADDGLGRPRGRRALRVALVGRGRRRPGHVPRRGLRGAVDHHLPAARPGGGAAGQDPARAQGEPGPLAGRHGGGLRPGPLSGQARERPISAFCSTAALTPAARQVA